LWAQIVAANAAPVAAALRTVAEPLLALATALDDGEGGAAARRLLEAGRRGRALLPGKHGRPATPRAVVEVVVPDRPGALAALLAAVAAQTVNLEDLRVDHAPGQPVGIAELVVEVDRRDQLAEALRGAGWEVSAGASEAL
jgi:prephenate dehydrogenase